LLSGDQSFRISGKPGLPSNNYLAITEDSQSAGFTFHFSLVVFHFKKFSIDDSKAAMKIGTDTVMLGAWTPCENETRILDIGTGSGILALMMAQRNTTIPIDAVEIEFEAATLAQENIQLSPWHLQIQVFNVSVQEYCKLTQRKYSLVICNPPFFTDSMKAHGNARNLARHNDSLPVTELLKCTLDVLTATGKAAFIIPAEAYQNWKSEAAGMRLFPSHITRVKSSDTHKPHRFLIAFSRVEMPFLTEDELSIYTSRSLYSKEYQELTKDFYLNF
jgi:tRNA1Val (adenine37-N6)-methyltransferase